jgi:hypothetical protein
MDTIRLKEILATFTDDQNSLIMERGRLVVQLHDELIEATVKMREGYLVVTDDGREWPAANWIAERVAKIPLLAQRILNTYPASPLFVTPRAEFVDRIERSPSGTAVTVEDATLTALQFLDERVGGVCSVEYLTSDAGEGKTTLISHIANQQARRFLARQTDWLLVPIALGGRAFLRFDDVVAAALMNHLRFPRLYFESFIQMVRLGILVPALDGFEEVFVETAEGDAISSLGALITQMRGEGTLLIAARKAYFEYKGLATQAKLLDSLPDVEVDFATIRLLRWGKSEFIRYCELNSVENPEAFYEALSSRIGNSHSLLTRAVLVHRLIDLAKSVTQDAILELVQPETDVFYARFIDKIIEREAYEKWLGFGEPREPLLTLAEHHELLGYIAEEMWVTKSGTLPGPMLDSLAELFCETHGKSSSATRQVRDRLRTHALIIKSGASKDQFGFDHDEFREFFLGEELGRFLVDGVITDVRRILRADSLPSWSLDVATAFALEQSGAQDLLQTIVAVGKSDSLTSFVRENSGALAVRVLDKMPESEATVAELTFPTDSLRGRRFQRKRFQNCYFRQSSIENSNFNKCRFENCEFERLDLASGPVAGSDPELSSCKVRSVTILQGDDHLDVYDPEKISFYLQRAGFSPWGDVESRVAISAITDPDPKLEMVQKAVATFRRTTQASEGVLRLRLSNNASEFFRSILPELLSNGVLERVENAGGGNYQHFKLRMRLSELATLFGAANNSYAQFLALLRKKPAGVPKTRLPV